jgi:hypothetical protein
MYYIGQHRTNNIEDGYLGSGLRLKRAIKKYGEEHFVRELLFIFDGEKEMNLKEQELVDWETISDANCYNLVPGGYGGDNITNHPRYKEICEKMKLASKHLTPKDWRIGKTTKQINEINNKKSLPGNKNGMFGKTHSEELKTEQGLRAIRQFKGKSYEEVYGKKKSDILKKKRSEAMTNHRKTHPISNKQNPNVKKILLISPTGEVFNLHGNLRVFCKSIHIGAGSIIEVLKGRIPEYKGWTGKYL